MNIMNIVIAPLSFISVTLIRPIFSSIFKLLKPNHHHSETLESHHETGRDYPLENTAQVPNTDAADAHSNHVVNMHEMEMEPDYQRSVTSAASSGSATVLSNLTWRMQPQPENATGDDSHEYVPESPYSNMAGNIIQAPNDDNRLRKWLYFLVVTYLTAIGISLQALEIITKTVPELSESFQFHYFRMFLVISLVYLTISAFIRLFSVPAALKIGQLAVLFSFLAFILVITIPDFPSQVIKVSSVIFIVPLSIVFLATYIWRP